MWVDINLGFLKIYSSSCDCKSELHIQKNKRQHFTQPPPPHQLRYHVNAQFRFIENWLAKGKKRSLLQYAAFFFLRIWVSCFTALTAVYNKANVIDKVAAEANHQCHHPITRMMSWLYYCDKDSSFSVFNQERGARVERYRSQWLLHSY